MIILPNALADLEPLLTGTPPDGPGLYFLIDGVEIVYVGSSKSPKRRVRQHELDQDMDFDSVAYLPTGPGTLRTVERRCIGECQPKHNTNSKRQVTTRRELVPGFARRLREARDAAGLTLQEIARQARTHWTSVAKIEAEARAPTLRIALALAAALGISVDELVSGRKARKRKR
jgi:DNA-binding XRE family transcriptional regulator